MKAYIYCRVGNPQQLRKDKTDLKVLAKNKIIDEINKSLRNGTSYHANIIQLLDRKDN